MLCCSELKRRLKAQKKAEEKQEKLAAAAAAKQQNSPAAAKKADTGLSEDADIDPHVCRLHWSVVSYVRSLRSENVMSTNIR